MAFIPTGILLVPVALADQVTLKNGDRLTGEILRSDGKVLTLRSEFAGVVSIQWAAVDRISSDNPINLELKDNQRIVGSVSPAEAGRLTVRTADTGTVAVDKEAVATIRSKEEQAAYEAELDRLRNPGLLDLWRGTADAGLNLTRGNASTSTLALGMNAARTTPRDRITVYANSLYATNSTTGVDLTTANAIRGGARYDFNIGTDYFAFGLGDLEFDEFQKLDLRTVVGAGIGWHVLRNDTTTFDLFGGGSLNKEFFSTGLNRSSGEVLIGEEWGHRLSDRISLRQRMTFLPNLSETGEYRLNFDASAVTNISSWLGWHLSLSDRFLSNPVPGTKKNDVLLSTGIRITFGR